MFEYDHSVSAQDSVQQIFQVIRIEPRVSSIVFITGMLGVLRQLFCDADIKIPCCLYVEDKSQSRKTTLVNFSTALYGRSRLQDLSGVSTLRVSSTEFKSEECVDALKDATFVFDDLYIETNTKLRKDYEKRVRNIIRNFADNSPRTTARSSFRNNCQVIITSEYMLDTKTDVGRLMVLVVDKPINSQNLSSCQEQPLSVSTFYYHFIKWISCNYNTIVSDVKEKFKAFRISAGLHNFGYERLYEQSFLLNYAYGLFLNYTIELGYEIRDRKFIEDQFLGYVNEALSKQKMIIENLDVKEHVSFDFSFELLEMLKDGTIVPGKDGDKCFIKKNRLYIKAETFCRCLNNKFKREFSPTEVSGYFKKRYIAEVYSDNTLKRYKNERYLILDITELHKDAKEDSYKIDNLFFK